MDRYRIPKLSADFVAAVTSIVKCIAGGPMMVLSRPRWPHSTTSPPATTCRTDGLALVLRGYGEAVWLTPEYVPKINRKTH